MHRRAMAGLLSLPYVQAHRLASSFASPFSYEAALASRPLRWLLVRSTASRLARLHNTSTRDPVFSEKRFMRRCKQCACRVAKEREHVQVADVNRGRR